MVTQLITLTDVEAANAINNHLQLCDTFPSIHRTCPLSLCKYYVADFFCQIVIITRLCLFQVMWTAFQIVVFKLQPRPPGLIIPYQLMANGEY